jgi:probable F420-dependent oxidoreductase
VKVRIGVGAGLPSGDAASLAELASLLESLGFDSLWLPEVLTAATVDPLVGLAWVGSRVARLKLGTTMLLTGRHPVRLAKQLADLDVASGGRLLVTFVPGLARSPERQAIGVDVAERGARIEETLPLLRTLWGGGTLQHDGPSGGFDGVSITARPAQDPFDVWLGGRVPAALERCGRLADGWLPSGCTPGEAAAGKTVVDAAAEAAGRQISPEHFGVSLAYATSPLAPAQARAMAAVVRRPVEELPAVVPVGLRALRETLEAFVAVGFSKFVVRPVQAPGDRRADLEALADAVLDLQR